MSLSWIWRTRYFIQMLSVFVLYSDIIRCFINVVFVSTTVKYYDILFYLKIFCPSTAVLEARSRYLKPHPPMISRHLQATILAKGIVCLLSILTKQVFSRIVAASTTNTTKLRKVAGAPVPLSTMLS